MSQNIKNHYKKVIIGKADANQLLFLVMNLSSCIDLRDLERLLEERIECFFV